MPTLEKTKELLEKAKSAFSGKQRIPEAETLHTELVKIVTQLKTTQNIISNNSSVINELAEENTDLANLLKNLAIADTKDIEEKILNREAITQKEATKLIKTFEGITDTVSNIGVSLDVKLSDILDDFKPLLSDSRLDIQSRRKILDDLRDFAEKQNLSTDVLKDIQNINTKQFNFTKKETKHLDNVLSDLSKNTKGLTTKATLTELNTSLDSAVITKQELSDILEKKTESGESFGQKFKKIPEFFSQGAGGAKTAGISSGIDMLLPGLGSLLEATGTSSKIAEVLSFKNVKGLASKSFDLSKKGISKLLPTKEQNQQVSIEERGEVLKTVSNENTDDLKKSIENTSQNNLIESKKGTDQLININRTLASLSTLQEENKEVQNDQLEILEDGFDDLKKSQRKIRKSSAKSGKGKGVLGVLAGLGLMGLGGKGLGLLKGLGGSALAVGGKGTGLLKGGVAKTVAKGAASLATSTPGLAIAAGAGGFAIGTAIDRFFVKERQEKFLEERHKKKVKEKFGDAATREELVKQFGEKRVLKSEQRKEAKKNVVQIKEKQEVEKELFNESFKTTGELKEKVEKQKSAITHIKSIESRTQGTLKTEEPKAQIIESKDFELKSSDKGMEQLQQTLGSFAQNQSRISSTNEIKRTTDRSLSIDDPYLAFVQMAFLE